MNTGIRKDPQTSLGDSWDQFTGELNTVGHELLESAPPGLQARPNLMSEAAADLVSEMAGTPHNHYQLCYVELEVGQALQLELNPPSCRYWSVHLNNWWLESPEFHDGQSVSFIST